MQLRLCATVAFWGLGPIVSARFIPRQYPNVPSVDQGIYVVNQDLSGNSNPQGGGGGSSPSSYNPYNQPSSPPADQQQAYNSYNPYNQPSTPPTDQQQTYNTYNPYYQPSSPAPDQQPAYNTYTPYYQPSSTPSDQQAYNTYNTFYQPSSTPYDQQAYNSYNTYYQPSSPLPDQQAYNSYNTYYQPSSTPPDQQAYNSYNPYNQPSSTLYDQQAYTSYNPYYQPSSPPTDQQQTYDSYNPYYQPSSPPPEPQPTYNTYQAENQPSSNPSDAQQPASTEGLGVSPGGSGNYSGEYPPIGYTIGFSTQDYEPAGQQSICSTNCATAQFLHTTSDTLLAGTYAAGINSALGGSADSCTPCGTCYHVIRDSGPYCSPDPYDPSCGGPGGSKVQGGPTDIKVLVVNHCTDCQANQLDINNSPAGWDNPKIYFKQVDDSECRGGGTGGLQTY